jgi:catalase
MAGPGRPKGSSGINKSQKIREFLEQNPESTTTEVMECLAQQGIDVSQALVAGVRSRAFGTKRKKGEITISEIENLNSKINERYEDREVIGQVLEDFESWSKELGGMDRFVKAMKTALQNESMIASDSNEAVEDEEDEEYQEEVQNAIASDSDSEAEDYYDDEDDEEE